MLRREAATWFARLQSGRDPETELQFRRWHDRDPAHAAAYARIRETYDRTAVLRHSKLASATPARAGVGAGEPRHAWALAAAIALVIAAGLYLASGGVLAPGGTEAVMLTTDIGEIREVRLSDGTKLTLDTSTSVEVELGPSSSRAVIKAGRARFDLARSDAPFVIEAGSTRVSADGGILDVANVDGETMVDVLAGNASVRTESGGSKADVGVAAGEGIVSAPGIAASRHALVASNWTSGKLEFKATPLDVAVALANRYSKRKIILEPGLGKLRVTGAFRAGDASGFSAALAEAFHLSAKQEANGNLLLSRGASGPP